MITLIFFAIIGAIIYIQYKREKNVINLVSLLMAPYAVLVFLNNFFMYKIGFNKIEDEVLVMLLLTFICFFLG